MEAIITIWPSSIPGMPQLIPCIILSSSSDYILVFDYFYRSSLIASSAITIGLQLKIDDDH
jgi:hypothetical protein